MDLGRGDAGRMLADSCDWQHNDAMATAITIRDVPDEVRDELASRAALSGRSLQEYVRSQLIEFARRPDPEVLLARVRDRKQRLSSRLSAEAILGHRDVDRR
jgi:antitoxin FitA